MKKSSHSNQNQPQPIKQEKTLALPQFQWISNLALQFQQQIIKPLQIRQSIFKNSEPQRCFIHSIAYSLYCTICRKMLCAGCMYSNLQHRKHRVVPIENATQEIKEDIKTFQSKIMKIGQQAEGLVNSNSQTVMKIQNQYNPLVMKVKQFYENIRIHLKKTEKQHLQALKLLKDSAIAQISLYNRQLGTITDFLISKLQSSIREGEKLAATLTSRVILQNLTQASSFINQSFLDCEKFKFPTDIQKVANIQNQIEIKINSLLSNIYIPITSNRVLQINKNKSRSMIKGVTFVETHSKHQQKPTNPNQNPRRKNLSTSNLAGRSQIHKI